MSDIMLDTGTLVKRDLVPGQKLIPIRCAHGDIITYPIAKVERGRETLHSGSRCSRQITGVCTYRMG